MEIIRNNGGGGGGAFWRDYKVAGDIEDDIKKRKSAKFENEMSKFCMAIIYPFYNISSSNIAVTPQY